LTSPPGLVLERFVLLSDEPSAVPEILSVLRLSDSVGVEFAARPGLRADLVGPKGRFLLAS